MPVFIAFAAFLLLVFGHRLGLPIAPWVVTMGPFGSKRKTPGQKSGVRTQTLEMVLDHDSGGMEGRCLKGRFTGRALSSLSQTESLQLLEELRSAKSLASQAGVARALGVAGSLSTLDPLAKMLRDTSLTSGARAFAAVALGMVCDRERLPWNAFLSAGVNYPSATATLSDGQAGILDIL